MSQSPGFGRGGTIDSGNLLKLQAKVPLLAVAILTVFGGASAAVLLYHQRSISVSQFRGTAQAVAVAIRGSLREYMLMGDLEYLRDALVSVAGTGVIDKVALISQDGTVASSSNPSEAGQRAEGSQVGTVLVSGVESMEFEKHGTTQVFHAVTPVFNEPACQGCHDPGKTVLGAIDVTIGTTVLTGEMRRETLLIVVLALLAFASVGGGLAFMLRRTALNRLAALSAAAAVVSGGDYAARSPVGGKDEIGVLAGAFNKMATSVEERDSQLDSARRQLAEWNVSLEGKIRQKTRELSTMNAVLNTLSKSLDPVKLVQDALRTIASTLEIEICAAYLTDATGRLASVAEVGVGGEGAGDLRALLGDTAEETGRSGTRNVLDQRTLGQVDVRLGSLVAFPLVSQKLLGVLLFSSHSRDKFGDDLSRLLASMCDAISMALENANAARSVADANRLREQLLQKLISAQEEERRRIARELHDEATQSLAALAVSLEDLAATLPEGRKVVRQRLLVLKEQVVATFSDIRDLALELRPSALDDIGLSAAIDWCARSYLERRGLGVDVKTIGKPINLPAYTETMLFRIAQEALVNIIRHADATRVRIDLTYTAIVNHLTR